MPSFPDFFPANFDKMVREAGGCLQVLNVYRIAKFGIIDFSAFKSSLEEDIECNALGRQFASDLDACSTSCYEMLREIENRKKLFMRRGNPKAIIIQGITSPDCGPSQRTSDRTGTRSSHVDWWIYQDANPCIYFTEVTA